MFIFNYFIPFVFSFIFLFFLNNTVNVKIEKSSNYSYFKFSVFSFFVTVIIISIYAIIKTKFQTVFLISFFAGFYLIALNINRFSFSISNLKAKDWYAFLHITIVCSFFFAHQFYFIYDFEKEIFIPNHPDFIFSANVAKGFNNHGQENFFMEAPSYIKEFKGSTPYHYFEI